MKIFGPLTTREQAFDGRRTLNNRGSILFVLLVVLTFGLAPIDKSIARIFGSILFLCCLKPTSTSFAARTLVQDDSSFVPGRAYPSIPS